jgi:DNA polymerase elongation subunit (family B)
MESSTFEKLPTSLDKTFRLYDFNIYNEKVGEEEKKDTSQFFIQMFGVNEKGKSCSIVVEGFKPFFYVKVEDFWNDALKDELLKHIKKKIEYNPTGTYYEDSICECKIIKRKKLYGFDGGKYHKFIKFSFQNIIVFNKVKNLWYMPYIEGLNRQLLPDGLYFKDTNIYLYEANIPPLLRFFHIKDISPSGWISLPNTRTTQIKNHKTTNCDYEFKINYKNIISLNEKEVNVPLKICSFDIEASSSHGDFPVPVKSYKKLASNIIEYYENFGKDLNINQSKNILNNIILCAFGYNDDMDISIDKVYPIIQKSREEIIKIYNKWIDEPIKNINSDLHNQFGIESMFEKMQEDQEQDLDGDGDFSHFQKKTTVIDFKKSTIINIICDKKLDRSIKLFELNKSLSSYFPKLEGDKVTFIGSTFLRNGEKEPYLNHCVVLNTCGPVDIENVEIESYSTERDLLIAWRDIIQKEDPDIIVGYNIFGFDYQFLFNRAEENKCIEEFLKLSKNKNEICGTKDLKTGQYKLEQTSIQLASGQHDLTYIKMTGRIQIDLYNFFRREENLSSYKLDYVAGYFIGDYIKSITYSEELKQTTIKSLNMTGLQLGSFIHFEEIGHSVEYYDGGKKFLITSINKEDGIFTINSNISPDMSKKIRWCLAKDDVTPQDIFRMTNGSEIDRAVIAKYCIQDCNLVLYLMNKVDVWTGFSEMSKICSVPINFIVLRGQGIKLTSYVSKKCREKKTLMPVMEKSMDNDGFEGAAVLNPKCDLYLDNPIACVDYASLYPSSMMSENISPDSKVWTKEYNLQGKLIKEWGETDDDGNFIYDNLPNYEYVNIPYDTFVYRRKSPSSAAEKIKVGYKICRFAQFPNGTRAIMPSILEELLLARKTTRKLIPNETNDFMKNVLDKRQTGYKLTANSLYGQCGAKTSSFYEKDCAASTTATGRLLLNYAKKIIEECYGNNICETEKYGPVLTKAEYIYGDSVANYTPIYIKINGKVVICTIEELGLVYGNNNWINSIEEGKQDKEFCELNGVETWSDKGWTILYRVIRHRLASHKKMMRVVTSTGLVDVTDDHSLLKIDGTELSPSDACIGTKLLHNKINSNMDSIINELNDEYTCYKQSNNFEFHIKKKHIEIAKICAYLQAMGLYIKISNFGKKYNYNVDFYKNNINNDENGIINIINLPEYKGFVYDLTTENSHFAAGIGNLIVHNTDSVFFTFNLATPTGELIRGKKALEITIELAQQAGHLASKFLKGPHDLEYEKTFMPFCLLSKKRYVGILYETDPEKGKRKEMGIVLKRRDNAPIVKDVYGGVIDILMKEQNIEKAINFLKDCLRNMVDEKYPIEKLIISKSLRTGYKNPKQICHKVLADRITARDPGNKPGSGDRIPYVFIHNANKKALQGEKIETPTFIKDNNLKIDYSFYITNQIMKPVSQVFALVLEKMWNMQHKYGIIAKFKKDVDILRNSIEDDEKFEDKLDDLKNKEVKMLLFDEFLRETNNKKENIKPLTSYFTFKK